MNSILLRFFIVACTSFSLYAAVQARLYVKEAGVGGKNGVDLPDNFRICPPARNFSVICRPTIPDAGAVVFYVNDKPVRRETVAPYAIAGDNPKTGNFFPWSPPHDGGMVKIACVVFRADGKWAENIVADGRFNCPHTTSKLSLEVFEAESGGPTQKDSVTLVEGFKFCPYDYSANGFSISCVPPAGSNATYAAFEVNGRHVRREGVLPYTIAGDRSGYSNPWTPPHGLVSITCRTNHDSITVKGTFDCPPVVTPRPAISVSPVVPAQKKSIIILPSLTSPKPTPTRAIAFTPAPRTEVNASYCVTWDATEHTNRRDDLWVDINGTNSLTYRPLDTCSTCTYPEGTAPLVYKFTVNTTSRYAITMDSTTPHVTEHNDCWFKFDSLSLYGYSAENSSEVSIMNNLNESQKAYQNFESRAKAAFSVDNNIHSFATTQLLIPGVEYTFTVEARSTQFTLNGIIMFPCSGDNCWHYSPHFLTYLRTCNIPSASITR